MFLKPKRGATREELLKQRTKAHTHAWPQYQPTFKARSRMRNRMCYREGVRIPPAVRAMILANPLRCEFRRK